MRPLRMLSFGAVTALLLAACGSDGEQLSEEEFVAQANEICRVGTEELTETFESFLPTDAGADTPKGSSDRSSMRTARRCSTTS